MRGELILSEHICTSFTDWNWGLAHHGIRGQKWGVRRFQNQDGTLTAAGRQHYGVSEGGNRHMSRQFNRNMRKLNRLQKKTDIELQGKRAEKLDRISGKAAKIGTVGAGVAAAGFGTAYGLKAWNSSAKEATKKILKGLTDQQDAHLSKAYDDFHKILGESEYVPGKGYSDEAWNRVNAMKDEMERKWDNLQSQKDSISNKFNKEAQARQTAHEIAKYVGYAGAATAAIGYGTAAVTKIMAHNARKRMTDAGHRKAVEKYKQQYEKMTEMFKDTPYSELVKKYQASSGKR